jgi:hypothetical protein
MSGTSDATATSAKTVAVGMDLGSYNARVATFDENLQHPVCAHNSDGHRATRIILEGDDRVTASNLECFIRERLVQLASDAAHTKDLSIVTSIPNEENHSALEDEWLQVLHKVGGVMTEAAAVCLAYDLEEEANNNRRTLVVDGGASGLKVAILRGTNGLWWNLWHNLWRNSLKSSIACLEEKCGNPRRLEENWNELANQALRLCNSTTQ